MIIRLLTFPFRYGFTRLKIFIGKLDTVEIEPLYAFGNESLVLVKGRLIESYKQSKPSDEKTYLQNILAAIRRYAGSSVPNVRCEIRLGELVQITESDPDGLFSCSFNRNKKSDPEHIKIRLITEEGIKPPKQETQFPVTVIKSNHPRGIISDIDDTILISHATRIGKKIWLSISKNAYTRRPFPGVSHFYKALTNNGDHPVFYVSSSDWNLYEMINDFLEYRQIPPGILLLKDLHVDLKNIWKSGGGSHQHKLEKIKILLNLYPGMKFILIGDSGQHDPEVYSEIIRQYPERILAVYIREIRIIKEQRRKLLETRITEPNSPSIVFVKTSEEAFKHAQNHLLISGE